MSLFFLSIFQFWSVPLESIELDQQLTAAEILDSRQIYSQLMTAKFFDWIGWSSIWPSHGCQLYSFGGIVKYNFYPFQLLRLLAICRRAGIRPIWWIEYFWIKVFPMSRCVVGTKVLISLKMYLNRQVIVNTRIVFHSCFTDGRDLR